MRSLHTLLILTATACVAPADAGPNWGAQPVWLEPDQLGYEEQMQWGLPLPPGFRVLQFPVEEFRARCDAQFEGPCDIVLGYVEWPATAVLRADLDTDVSQRTLLHELGHLLRGDAGHIECADGEEHVMCAWITSMAVPTSVDLQFVAHIDSQN